MKIEIAKEFLQMALQRLEMEALESADHSHVKQINEAILNINQAIDALVKTKVEPEQMSGNPGKAIQISIEDWHKMTPGFDPFYNYRGS